MKKACCGEEAAGEAGGIGVQKAFLEEVIIELGLARRKNNTYNRGLLEHGTHGNGTGGWTNPAPCRNESRLPC